MIYQKQLENVKCFKYLDNIITGDARSTREMKSRKKTLFTSKLGLSLNNKRVNFYTWTIAFYGAKTWTLRKVGQKNEKC
jgi:hypothetical protein